MKGVVIASIVAAVLIGGALVISKNAGSEVSENNVSIENGKQIIEITARGGYYPQVSKAKSGVPTILRIRTSGTFDCSSSVRIPELGITKILPNSGSTDIDIGTPKQGSLSGSCGMGMFPFQINFLYN